MKLDDGRYRMYVEARGPADRATVITSAISSDQLSWEHEDGIRFETKDGLGGKQSISVSRCLPLSVSLYLALSLMVYYCWFVQDHKCYGCLMADGAW